MPSTETMSGSMTETAPSPRAPLRSSSPPPPLGVLPLNERLSHPLMAVEGNLPPASSSSSSAAAAVALAGTLPAASGVSGVALYPLNMTSRAHSLPPPHLHPPSPRHPPAPLFSHPPPATDAPAMPTTVGGGAGGGEAAPQSPACGARQLSKLKRFLTTLMQVRFIESDSRVSVSFFFFMAVFFSSSLFLKAM